MTRRNIRYDDTSDPKAQELHDLVNSIDVLEHVATYLCRYSAFDDRDALTIYHAVRSLWQLIQRLEKYARSA